MLVYRLSSEFQGRRYAVHRNVYGDKFDAVEHRHRFGNYGLEPDDQSVIDLLVHSMPQAKAIATIVDALSADIGDLHHN